MLGDFSNDERFLTLEVLFEPALGAVNQPMAHEQVGKSCKQQQPTNLNIQEFFLRCVYIYNSVGGVLIEFGVFGELSGYI